MRLQLSKRRKNPIKRRVHNMAVSMGEDMVNSPPHYKGNRYESIDIIEDFSLGFNLGNAIKYILRCQRKGSKDQDLEKAIWYLKREIATASDGLTYVETRMNHSRESL